ncbi:hypothetical protein MYCTH_2296297 [Thermothelomyces thermophilus ATCC 42464]|uniref:Secondary alcohol dehydrogenase protein n=1 Tax=Thermothelomyces thermophilus (strain ATCC 42464 / BCRC 31852 / DSM 1799) TaxID=573729 RepID=G2Q1D3_THET4|nr:uncharacterized protein MYCTH_2296297 [Thermothelomyces thermophilus ATCC 42464]AEO54123.1 hypothetical protein MYCTH_2296297 [Thermothelomyces thermophilus ATCC 42464]
MSAESVPITPERFAAALKDLPLSSLHLKVHELRNSIAHLDYSNEQLRPFAEGIAPMATTDDPGTPAVGTRGVPDQDCVDAIRENEVVIERMQERIRLVRAEVESRGLNWDEFQSGGGGGVEDDIDLPKAEGETDTEEGDGSPLVNGAGVNGTAATTTTTTTTAAAAAAPSTTTTANGEPRHPAWMDGTFQTGVIRDGVVRMDSDPARQAQARQGGSLTDEELRRRVEEQMRGLGDDEDDDGEGGLHL